MAFRRKRRPKVVWLPPAAELRVGHDPAVSGIHPGAFQFSLDIAGAANVGDHVTALIPQVSDIPAAAFQGSALPIESLADIYSSGYRLRRCVGKIVCGLSQPGTATGLASRVLITCGLIVLRVNEDGTVINNDATAPENYYSPSIINSWADPWIWRRTWVLGNNSEALADDAPFFPEANTQYGSVMDGPHVDAKTARVISNEERLFLVADMMILATQVGAGTTSCRFMGDLRFVASLKQMAGNRRNASR